MYSTKIIFLNFKSIFFAKFNQSKQNQQISVLNKGNKTYLRSSFVNFLCRRRKVITITPIQHQISIMFCSFPSSSHFRKTQSLSKHSASVYSTSTIPVRVPVQNTLLRSSSQLQIIPKHGKQITSQPIQIHERVPIEKTYVSYRPVTHTDFVPREKTVTRHLAIEYNLNYVPYVQPVRKMEVVPVERVQYRVEYTPIQRETVYAPKRVYHQGLRRYPSTFTLKIDAEEPTYKPNDSIINTNAVINLANSAAPSNSFKKSFFSQMTDASYPMGRTTNPLKLDNKENFNMEGSEELWNLKQSEILEKPPIPKLQLNGSGKKKEKEALDFSKSSSLWIDKNAISVTSIEPPELDTK